MLKKIISFLNSLHKSDHFAEKKNPDTYPFILNSQHI